MKSRVHAALAFLAFLLPVVLCAQQVLYAPYSRNISDARFEVIGKVGNSYWVHKAKEKRKRQSGFSFEVYDSRINWLKTIPYTLSDSVFKEYFVAGNSYFDQLLFQNAGHQTSVLLRRYTPEGDTVAIRDTVASFPSHMKGDDFLLLRSQDGNKILLLGFEPIEGSPPHVHALLYNSNWDVLSHRVYKDHNLTQPFIQYDFSNHPLEDFDNSPVKLSNSGDWFMLAPGRRNAHYLLSHFNSEDSSFAYKVIQLTKHRGVQELSLSLDNEKGEAFAGILLNSSYPAIKKVRIVHYLFSHQRFAFDTTYQFSTLAAFKNKQENLFHEYFLPVPGRGFLLLKEHGRPFLSTYMREDFRKSNEEADDTVFTMNNLPPYYQKHEYTRYNQLLVRKGTYERGDLSLYYLPANKVDSCWSGLMNQEQTGELNSAELSYVFIPQEGKLVFLYNSLHQNKHATSSATTLDERGHPLDEGVVFWKRGNVLDFQKARQISARELAVPYGRNGLKGFAIIRM